MIRILTFGVCILCIMLAGCAARSGGIQASAQSAPTIHMGDVPSSSAIFVEVTDGDTTKVATDFKGMISALFQSEKNMRLAEKAEAADYILRVQMLKAERTDTKVVGMALNEAVAPALVGTLGGAVMGRSGGGTRGAGIGAGLGLALGLGLAFAQNADNTEDVWALMADVLIAKQQKGKKINEYKSRVAATAHGANLDYFTALPALEDSLAREILRAFVVEGT